MKTLNRRDFLVASGAAATTFAATPGISFAQGMGGGAPFSDYRALVCVFLFGGNDSFNMLVPRSNAEYAVYAQSRQNLAIDQADLLAINPAVPDGVDYGIHPSMPGLHGLFEAGAAAFVNNVGPLIEPTTKDQYFSGSVALPPQLFSHNDQQDQWQSLKGITQSATGWAGRMADLIRLSASDQRMATNASLFGSNLLQSAEETVAYVMGPSGPVSFAGFSSDPNQPGWLQREAFRRLLDVDYGSVYERAFADVQRRAIDAVDDINAALDDASLPPITTPFPQSQLGAQLQTVARLVNARNLLGMNRQVFFVAAGGFDSHDNQNQDQPNLLGGVSDAMTAFYDAMVELNVSDQVTQFTQSDFGRTLTSNGDGTDHAWGGNQLVIGDAVDGRRLFGNYPLLEIGGDEDVGGGRFIPSTSADQYAATLAAWWGIDDADLEIVAPNLGNFAERDLGLFS